MFSLSIFSSVDIPYIGDSLYTFDDTILFAVTYEDNIVKMYKYSLGNSEPTEIELPEEKWFIKKINVENEKVTVYTSRFMEDKGFLDYDNDVFVNIAKCFDFREFEDRVAEQTFEFRYVDKKFTAVKSIGFKKLGELEEYSKLCKNSEE